MLRVYFGLRTSSALSISCRYDSVDDLRIWPINCDDPDEIKHLVSIKRPEFIRLWRDGYDTNGKWTPKRLSCCTQPLPSDKLHRSCVRLCAYVLVHATSTCRDIIMLPPMCSTPGSNKTWRYWRSYAPPAI